MRHIVLKQAFISDETKFELFVAGLVFEDTYDANTTYQPGDIVSFGGYTYVATSIHSSSSPNLLNDWEIVTTGFKVVGTWDVATTYYQGDVVLLGGNSYVSKTTNTGQNPVLLMLVIGTSLLVDLLGRAFGTPQQNILQVMLLYVIVTLILLLLLLLAKNQKLMLLAHTGIHWQKVPRYNVLTDTGDILYRAGAGAARLPVGNNGQVLAVSPCWSSPMGK